MSTRNSSKLSLLYCTDFEKCNVYRLGVCVCLYRLISETRHNGSNLVEPLPSSRISTNDKKKVVRYFLLFIFLSKRLASVNACVGSSKLLFKCCAMNSKRNEQQQIIMKIAYKFQFRTTKNSSTKTDHHWHNQI